jgi:uncharacterized membrane protein
VRKDRTEAFSDGVFAVAATLLVFSVQVPDVKANLGHALLNLWPAYAAYAISFATILVIWVNHHSVLDNIKTYDRTLLYLNGFLLMTIAVVPFPTFLLAKYLVLGHDESPAAVAYGLTMSLASLSLSLISLYASRRGLFVVRFNLFTFTLGQVLYPLATLISLWNARLALVIYAAMVIYYAAYPLVSEARTRRRESARR